MQLAFIWDMDGTLVDSYPAIVPAALESLSAQGVSYDREKLYQEVIRTSVGDVLEKLAAEHNLDLLPLKADFNRRIGGIETILLYTEPKLASVSSSALRELQHFGVDITPFLPHNSAK